MQRKIRNPLPVAVVAGFGLAAAALAGFSAIAEETPGPTAEPLLETGVTILNQPLAYPSTAAPQITSAILTLAPRVETGLHRHEVPLFAHVLSGELTVTYEDAGTRVYGAGDTLMEAVGTPHNGRNSGRTPVRILVVFMGAEGAANTVPMN